MRVAIAQTRVVSAAPGSDPDVSVLMDNLANAEEAIKLANQNGADVIIFPEYFLQGIMDQGRQYLSLPSLLLEVVMINLAEEYKIDIVGSIVHGTVEGVRPPRPVDDLLDLFMKESSRRAESRLAWDTHLREAANAPTEAFTLYNEALYIASDRRVQGRYRKLNLWHPEREYLTPGDRPMTVFDTKWGRVGFLICWDLSHPAEAQLIARQGADVIFAPMYWLATDSEPMLSKHNTDPNYELHLVQSLAYARAFESECVLITCNAGGDPQEGFMGGSGVWAPLLGRVGGFAGSEVGVKVVNVDMRVLKDARELYKIRQDADMRCA